MDLDGSWYAVGIMNLMLIYLISSIFKGENTGGDFVLKKKKKKRNSGLHLDI